MKRKATRSQGDRDTLLKNLGNEILIFPRYFLKKNVPWVRGIGSFMGLMYDNSF